MRFTFKILQISLLCGFTCVSVNCRNVCSLAKTTATVPKYSHVEPFFFWKGPSYSLTRYDMVSPTSVVRSIVLIFYNYCWIHTDGIATGMSLIRPNCAKLQGWWYVIRWIDWRQLCALLRQRLLVHTERRALTTMFPIVGVGRSHEILTTNTPGWNEERWNLTFIRPTFKSDRRVHFALDEAIYA